MTYKQAWKLMLDGYAVRRASWSKKNFVYIIPPRSYHSWKHERDTLETYEINVCASIGWKWPYEFHFDGELFSMEDLVSNDWEICSIFDLSSILLYKLQKEIASERKHCSVDMNEAMKRTNSDELLNNFKKYNR